MKMVTLLPSGISLIIDDLPDLFKQSLEYFFVLLEINPRMGAKFYDNLADILKNAHSLRMPIVDEDMEIEIIKGDRGYIYQVCYFKDNDDGDIIITNGEHMTVQMG